MLSTKVKPASVYGKLMNKNNVVQSSHNTEETKFGK